MNLEAVFETSDPGLVAFVKSLLGAAGIEHVTDGEIAGEYFPTKLAGGVVRFQVRAEDAQRARALLTDLKA